MTSYGSIWKHLVFFSPVPKFFFILSAIRTSWKKFAHDRTHWHEDRNYLVKQSATIKGCILNASQRRKKMITLHVFSRRFHLFYVIAIRYSTECIFFFNDQQCEDEKKNRTKTMRVDTQNNCQTVLGIISTVIMHSWYCWLAPLLSQIYFGVELFRGLIHVWDYITHTHTQWQRHVTCQRNSIRNAIIAITESLCSRTLAFILFRSDIVIRLFPSSIILSGFSYLKTFTCTFFRLRRFVNW